MAEMQKSGLWVPSSAAPKVSEYKKAKPPVLGEKFGSWANSDLHYFTLPGGAVMQFDLNRLTLNDYRAMRDHYQVNTNLTLLSFMIHQIDWKIQCDRKEIRDELEMQIRENWSQLIRGISQAFWAGYSPMVLEYRNDVRDRRIRLNKVKDLQPERCRVQWDHVDGYSESGNAKPQIPIYDGIAYLDKGSNIPVDNSLWYPLLMENGNYYGRKLLRPAFIPWFFSNLIHLFANRYFERFGEPLPIGRAPFDDEVEVNGSIMTGREAMNQILSDLRSRSVVTLPSDREPERGNYEYDVEYLESQMRGADWERYLTRLDEEISLGLFTPILMLRTADVGSYNLGVNHMQVWMWMLNALAGDIKQYLDRYVIERIKAFNYGPNAPKATWEFRPMGKHNEETLRTIVAAIFGAGKVGVKDLDDLGQSIGLDLKEIREIRGDTAPGGGTDENGNPLGGRGEENDNTEPSDDRSPCVEAANAVIGSIYERIVGQAGRAERDGVDFNPTLGYKRKMQDALVADGFTAHEAERIVGEVYGDTAEFIQDLDINDYSKKAKYVEQYMRSSLARTADQV